MCRDHLTYSSRVVIAGAGARPDHQVLHHWLCTTDGAYQSINLPLRNTGGLISAATPAD